MSLLELKQVLLVLAPEFVLAVVICLVIVADMLLPLRRSPQILGAMSILGLVLGLLLLPGNSATTSLAGDTVIVDRLAQLFKYVFLTGTALTVLFSMRSRELAGRRVGEYYSLLLGSAFAAALLASANNIIVFILALETLSLCSYVLAGFAKEGRHSAEAGVKYLLYGAVASGIMLFGFSYLYGLTGTLQLDAAVQLLASQQGQAAVASLLVAALILAGIGFKVAMVPFHFWCPDVYQGSPTPVTAFLSVVSSAAGFSALLRLLVPLLHTPDLLAVVAPAGSIGVMGVLFGVLAVLSMTYGNLVALRQDDVKRLLAYSSIAHAGYLLLGLAVFSPAAIEAMLAYIIVYLFMNLGAFWVVIVLMNGTGSSAIASFRGTARHAPFLFAALFICLIALTGLPPTAGFVAKFLLFEVLVGKALTAMPFGAFTVAGAFFWILAIIAVANSVVSLYYYMKVAKVMVFEDAPQPPAVAGWADRLYAGVVVLPVLVLLYFSPLQTFVSGAVAPINSLIVAWLP